VSRTRKIVAVAVVWLGVGLVVALALVGHPPAASAHEEGAVAVCNWENFEQYGHDGYNWVWVRCNHTLHGHGYRYHEVAQLRREARAFRAYCGID
jgi:hypothetical protein